ncbi:MAG: MinD/ParA family protein [Actinobacteria bacterium]|nr:MinD/ParA family protein [Actinomycetota bacterium]
MNDQAKKLRELAQKIREERDRASLIVDPTIRRPEKISIDHGIIPKVKKTVVGAPPKTIDGTRSSGSTATVAELGVKERLEIKKEMAISPADNTASCTMGIHSTRIIAVSSGKGGVGKSNLVINLGIALAMRGKKVMVLDADLGLANIDVLLGINPKYTLQHLVDGGKTMQEILINGPHSLKIVPGGSGIPELANLSDDKRQKLIENFVELDSEADLALIDTGAGISKNVIAFIIAAREAIIITTPEPTAITDAYGLIKVITQRDIDVDIKIVINMVSSEKEGREIAGRIVMATKQFLNKQIEILGYVTSDPLVNASVRKQEPLILGYPGARASKCIRQIAVNLDKIDKDDVRVVKRNGFRGFLSRLFER